MWVKVVLKVKSLLPVLVVVYIFPGCLLKDDSYPPIDYKLELAKTYLSKVYKLKKIAYIETGVNTIPELRSNKIICLGSYLYEVSDIDIQEKQIAVLNNLIKNGIGEENLRRNKDVDSHFTGDYLFVFTPGLLGNSRDVLVKFKEDEPHLVEVGYLIYNYDKSTYKKLKSIID